MSMCFCKFYQAFSFSFCVSAQSYLFGHGGATKAHQRGVFDAIMYIG